MATNKPQRILLLSHARTACHLLEQLLSAQPGVIYQRHPFAPARQFQLQLLEEGPLSEGSQKTKDELLTCWSVGYTDIWSPFFSQARQDGMCAFLHCHPHFMVQPKLASMYVHDDAAALAEANWNVDRDMAQSLDNPTVLPDPALLSDGTVPIITIRNPITMVPSIYKTLSAVGGFERASIEAKKFSSTLYWQRLIYDWYLHHGGPLKVTPIIVDADDYMGEDHKAWLARLCARLGFDVGSINYSWAKKSVNDLTQFPAEIRPMINNIMKTLHGSEGVITGLDTKSMNLEEFQHSWTETFGKEGANEINELIGKTMSDYEYLVARKFA